MRRKNLGKYSRHTQERQIRKDSIRITILGRKGKTCLNKRIAWKEAQWSVVTTYPRVLSNASEERREAYIRHLSRLVHAPGSGFRWLYRHSRPPQIAPLAADRNLLRGRPCEY